MTSSSASETSTAADDQRNIFRFFDLPRELRNFIYRESLVTKAVPLGEGFQGSASNLCQTHLLVVNKQFKHEYTSEGARASTILTASDHGYDSSKPIDIPKAAREITAVQLNFAITEDVLEECLLHLETTKSVLARMSECRLRLRFDMMYAVPSEAATMLEELNQAWWLNFKGLADLVVYRASGTNMATTGPFSIFRFLEGRQLLMRWSAESKKVERIDSDD